MTDRRRIPRPCLGYGSTPCPEQRTVPTRYALRCKSCAAKQRQLDGTNPIERAWMGRFQKWWNDGAYETAWPFRRKEIA